MQPRFALVIGAGASHDLHYDFALGNELLQQISDRVTDRTSISTPNLSTLLKRAGFDESILERFVESIDTYQKAVKPIASIDGFIDEISLYPEFKLVKVKFRQIAKFSIVFHILGYEGTLEKVGLKHDSWIHELAAFIDRNNLLDEESLKMGYLRIITFNYDRIIEHYLYHHERFKGKQDKLKRFIDKWVLHVYGKIGDLEWQDLGEHFAFGEDHTDVDKILANKDKIDLMFEERLTEYREPFNKLWQLLHVNTMNGLLLRLQF
jgi:hypothetical protein